MLQGFIRSSYTVTVLSRLESSSTFPSNVRVMRADYTSPSSLVSAMINQDVVISMIGAAVVGDQTPFIDATHSAGVKRFIPSVIGPDTLNPGVREVIPTFPAKIIR
jgi:uncharacterized protein YbjT (DUF2867 family)